MQAAKKLAALNRLKCKDYNTPAVLANTITIKNQQAEPLHFFLLEWAPSQPPISYYLFQEKGATEDPQKNGKMSFEFFSTIFLAFVRSKLLEIFLVNPSPGVSRILNAFYGLTTCSRYPNLFNRLCHRCRA